MVFDSDYRDVTVVTAERWPQPSTDDTSWMYLGSLFIDSRFLDDVCNALLNARYQADGWATARADTAWQTADRDAEDDIPATFDRCDAVNAYNSADRWLSLIRQHSDVTSHLNVKITGVDLDKLSAADTEDRYAPVYKQILREHLIDARSHFFDTSMEVAYDQYHAHGPEQQTRAFKETLSDLDDPLTNLGGVQFLDTDHRSHDHGSHAWKISHLLQAVNTITGGTATLFTDDNLPHKQEKLSWMLKDLVQDSMDYEQPAVDRFTAAFYPKQKETGDTFYYWRSIQRSDPHKESLERFL